MLSKLKRVIKRIWRWPGRRGHSLFFFATLYITIGQSFYTTPMTPQLKELLWAHLQIFPIHYWGIIWITGGILNVVGVFWKNFEGLSFAVAAAIMAMWATGYAINQLLGHGHMSYIGFVIYASFSAFVLLISGWPEE